MHAMSALRKKRPIPRLAWAAPISVHVIGQDRVYVGEPWDILFGGAPQR